jgi:hypothetical protein
VALRSVYWWGEDPWQKQNKKPHVVLKVVGKRRLSIPLPDNNLQSNNRYISLHFYHQGQRFLSWGPWTP